MRIEDRRPICQVGLSRSGLYAVADWFIAGRGQPYEVLQGAWIDDIGDGRFVTVESVRTEFAIEGLRRCRERQGIGFLQLRDPYNWMASLQAALRKRAVVWSATDRPLPRWKQYAQLCREYEWLDYNRWHASADYRRALAERWDFSTSLDGQAWTGVPSRGGGSSFDGRSLGDVLNRYRSFVDDEKWRGQFDDEVVELARELFGMERPW